MKVPQFIKGSRAGKMPFLKKKWSKSLREGRGPGITIQQHGRGRGLVLLVRGWFRWGVVSSGKGVASGVGEGVWFTGRGWLVHVEGESVQVGFWLLLNLIKKISFLIPFCCLRATWESIIMITFSTRKTHYK